MGRKNGFHEFCRLDRRRPDPSAAVRLAAAYSHPVRRLARTRGGRAALARPGRRGLGLKAVPARSGGVTRERLVAVDLHVVVRPELGIARDAEGGRAQHGVCADHERR